MNITELSIAELREKIQKREISAVQITEAFLNKLK